MDTGTKSQQLRIPDDVDETSEGSSGLEGTSAARDSSMISSSSLTKQIKDSQEVPEDIRAFYGHPLTAASHSENGDGLALLHEYHSLPSIDRSPSTTTTTTTTSVSDPPFGTTISLCSRYDANSLEFVESTEELSGHDLAPPAPPPPLTSPPKVSISLTSSSSASFITSTDFIRRAPLFDDDNDTHEEVVDNDTEQKAPFGDQAFLNQRDSSLQELNSSPTTPMPQVNQKDRTDDYQDTTSESQDIFRTFEDDPALSYYESDCNGCEADIQAHNFQSSTSLPYELEMQHDVDDCLEKISERDGGRGDLGDDIFCVVTSGEMIIDGSKQAESMLVSQGFNPTDTGGIFGADQPTEATAKAKPKPRPNGKNTEMDGLLPKAPIKRRLAKDSCASRRRRGTDALPTDGCPQLAYVSYVPPNAQLTKAPLPSYDSNLTLASGSLLSQPFNYSTSENVTGQRGFAGHIASPSYQVSTVNEEELQYLDDEGYHQLVSSDELRLMSLGNQTVVSDQAAELTGMSEYRREPSSEVWQQPFTDEFKMVTNSGCFTQSQDPGRMQWCAISSSEFRPTLCSNTVSTSYATPITNQIRQPSPQTLKFRVPWATAAAASTSSNAPLDMTASINNHQNASVLLRSPQPSKFAAPISVTVGETKNTQLAVHNFLQITRPPIRRQRRKQAKGHSPGTSESVITASMHPQLVATDGSGFPSNGKIPHGSESYALDISLTQRQMPGLMPSDRLDYSNPESDRFTHTGRLDLGQSNKENNMSSGVEWTSASLLAQSPRLHQLQIHSPVQRRPKPTTDTSYISTAIDASDNSSSRLINSDVGQIQTGHPNVLDRSNLTNLTQNTINNNTSSSLAALPFPLPAVPPGYRLVITHHPLPSENEQEPQHITQLIIDNPSTAFQTSPDFVPCPQPYPESITASEVAGRLAAPRDGGRPTRPNTLELQATNQVTSTAVFSRIAVDGRAGTGTGSGFIAMKTEPPSPLDAGVHTAPPSTVNQIVLGPDIGQRIPPSQIPGEDLLEMSMREANVLQLASTHRQFGERQVFTGSAKQSPGGGHYCQSMASTPMSSDSSRGGSGSSHGTPFLEGIPVGDALLPLNLTGNKSILVNSAGVPSYPFELNNNSIQFGCRNEVIGNYSGSNTPSGAQSSDEWSRAWGSGMSIREGDGSITFQDENLTILRDNFPVTPEGIPGRMTAHRRVSSSSNSSRKVVRSRTPSVRRSTASVVEKIAPDRSGYEFYLDAPISTNARFDEDRVTYLNKGQYYSLILKYDPKSESDFGFKNTPVKSVVMVMFRERQSVDEELKAWEFWHSRQHSLKQRVLDIDGKKFGTDGAPISVDEIAYNAVNVVWKRQDQPVKVNIAVNCLSTDFSHQKGVKGNPLHIQIDTFADDTDSSILIHRAYCQIKVFCDKGADRKSREEERKKTKIIDSDMAEERHHEPCDRSFFYRMADMITQPVLFTPTNSLASKGNMKESSYSLDPSTSERGLSSYLDEDNCSTVPAKRSRSCSYDQQRAPQRILLYAREEADDVFTALMLESPTLASLSNAIYEKYNIPVNAIKNIYNRSRKCVTVKVDDNVVRHFANESTFIIHIEQQQQKPVVNDNDQAPPTAYYDVTLSEIQP